jgi:hypothetical protein
LTSPLADRAVRDPDCPERAAGCAGREPDRAEADRLDRDADCPEREPDCPAREVFFGAALLVALDDAGVLALEARFGDAADVRFDDALESRFDEAPDAPRFGDAPDAPRFDEAPFDEALEEPRFADDPLALAAEADFFDPRAGLAPDPLLLVCRPRVPPRLLDAPPLADLDAPPADFEDVRPFDRARPVPRSLSTAMSTSLLELGTPHSADAD